MTYNLRSIRPDKPSGQVELSDSAVFINNFESTSTEVIKSIKDLLVSNKNSTPVAAVDSLLNLGAMVYQLGSTSTDIEHMKNSARELANIFEASTEDVIHKFTSKVDDLVHPEQGILNRVAIETVDKTRDSINALFVGNTAPVTQEILSKVNEKLDTFAKEMHRVIGQSSTNINETFSMDSENSPLKALKSDLIESSQNLNKQVTDKIDAVNAKVEAINTKRQIIMNSTKKGLPFEDSVFEVLAQIATASADEAIKTGQTSGLIKNCKKGDVTVSVNKLASRGHNVNIVFEAKSMAMSRDEWRKELNLAMTNRAAEISVAVVQTVDQMPNKSRTSIQDNQQLMVAFDPEFDDPAVLACIYNVAKAYAVSRSLEGTQVNFKVIQEAVQQLQFSISDLESIEGALKTSHKALEKIDSARINIKGTIQNQSQRLSSLIGCNLQSEDASA
jgi:hypothetical protein